MTEYGNVDGDGATAGGGDAFCGEGSVEDLVRRARDGDDAALGALLDGYRDQLRSITERLLDERLATRVDASDIIQLTCISAHRKIGDFVGENSAEFLDWLRRIHVLNISNAYRDHAVAQNRSIEREVATIDELSSLIDSRRPSATLHAADSIRVLTGAITKLPPDQATAIRLRYLDGLALKQVAQRMERTEGAVVGLVWRGLENLRKHLPDADR